MTKNIDLLLQLFQKNPNNINMGARKLASWKKVSVEEVLEAKRLYRENKNKALYDHCKEIGIDPSNVNSFWHKTKDFSLKVNNQSDSNIKDEILSAFDDIINRYDGKGIKSFIATKLKDPKALKITISDAHIGMNASNGVFQYEYNADIFSNSMNKVFSSIIKEYNTHGIFDLLLLDDLGDYEDGWDSQTTRGGHELDQNMTNAEMFDVCVDTKVRLIESLVETKVANKIILRSITNSNHSQQFSLIVNSAIQKIINRLYSEKIVEIDILDKFIEHRTYGDHCFILCHGKDAKYQFKGLPLILNDKTIKFITDYIDFYDIKSDYIHFEKGDLHQLGYQRTRKFDYRNYMSFAPPSSWQSHNFGDCVSGYSIQVIPKFSNEISHTDYFLDYKIKK